MSHELHDAAPVAGRCLLVLEDSAERIEAASVEVRLARVLSSLQSVAERVQEVCEQVVNENLLLDRGRQLCVQPRIGGRGSDSTPVVSPIIVKELFDLVHEALGQRLSAVEARHQREPLGELVVLTAREYSFHLSDLLHQVVHEVRKDGDAQKEHDCADGLLLERHGAHVTEANGRQRCQSIVESLD